jgi:hypothetical protein
MKAPTKYLCLLAAAWSMPLAACAHQWFSLAERDARPGSTVVEVDLETVRLRGGSGEAVIRVTYPERRSHAAGFEYRSFVATAHIDCTQPSVALVSAAYFAQAQGNGPRVGNDSTGRAAGMPPRLLESIPAAARQALLKAACS